MTIWPHFFRDLKQFFAIEPIELLFVHACTVVCCMTLLRRKKAIRKTERNKNEGKKEKYFKKQNRSKKEIQRIKCVKKREERNEIEKKRGRKNKNKK